MLTPIDFIVIRNCEAGEYFDEFGSASSLEPLLFYALIIENLPLLDARKLILKRFFSLFAKALIPNYVYHYSHLLRGDGYPKNGILKGPLDWIYSTVEIKKDNRAIYPSDLVSFSSNAKCEGLCCYESNVLSYAPKSLIHTFQQHPNKRKRVVYSFH